MIALGSKDGATARQLVTRLCARDSTLGAYRARISFIFGSRSFYALHAPTYWGELATIDLVFLFLIAEAAARALGDYTAVADGVILIASLMGWNYLLNFLSFHVPFSERLVAAPPLQVVRNGELLRRNMRREFLPEEELIDHLRQGFDEIRDVKDAYIEGEGKITVISRMRLQLRRVLPGVGLSSEVRGRRAAGRD